MLKVPFFFALRFSGFEVFDNFEGLKLCLSLLNFLRFGDIFIIKTVVFHLVMKFLVRVRILIS